MGVTLLLVSLVLTIIAIQWIWMLISHRGDPPNLPGLLPLIGHSYRLLTDSEGFLDYIKEIVQFGYKNNGVVKLWLGIKPFYVVTDPETAALIFRTCLGRDSITYKFGKDVLNQGLLIAPAPIWKVNRKLLNPAFGQQMLDHYIIVFNKQARKLVKEISKEVSDASFDQLIYTKKFAMESICLNAMGVDISDASSNKIFVESIDQMSTVTITRFRKLWLHSDLIFKLSNLKKVQDHCIKVFNEVSQSALQKRKEELIQNSRLSQTHNSEIAVEKQKRFIDILLESNAFSTQKINDEVVTILVAGIDTTANVLACILTMIGSFPDVQDLMVAEIKNELKDFDEDITRNDLTRLTYMEAVIKETLRFKSLTPWLLIRSIDTELKTQHITLKAGTDCILLLDGLHRHPSWGPDVNEFKPGRWLDPATLRECSNAFAGFGLGRRNCIGKNYAMASLKILLIYFLRKFRIKSDYTKMTMELGILLKPASGHEIRIEYR